MIKLLSIFFLCCPFLAFGQGSVETSFGRMIDVEVWDGKSDLKDFVLKHCCTGWKWGSNKLLILGKDDSAVYAVTSSAVKDGSDEEVELNLLRTDNKGNTTSKRLFKREENAAYDTVLWKTKVVSELDNAEIKYGLDKLEVIFVAISTGNVFWIAEYNEAFDISISWFFDTYTEHGHDYYFSWRVETVKQLLKK